jgi:hypothetical protein|uniref:Uncharacterized protein n=1 Tax=Agrobacterium albertimagni TaxID=147266 RepID=A0A7C1T4S1_9HYPH
MGEIATFLPDFTAALSPAQAKFSSVIPYKAAIERTAGAPKRYNFSQRKIALVPSATDLQRTEKPTNALIEIRIFSQK